MSECERCGRPEPDDADYAHAAGCMDPDCTYGEHLCWGGCTKDDEIRHLRETLAEAKRRWDEHVAAADDLDLWDAIARHAARRALAGDTPRQRSHR